jgi:aspartate-semialdehyde dehydrogenase
VKNVAVLGARCLVGHELISILDQRNYPVQEMYLYQPDGEPGQSVIFNGSPIEILSNYAGFQDKVDLVFCCLDRVRARALVSKFKKKSLVIDLSGAFRFAPAVLHIIPEINGKEIKEHKGIIANPSPATIQLMMALYPLHQKFNLDHLHVISLNAVSDLGQDALDELNYEYEFLAVGEDVEKAQDSVFPHTIGGNIIPQIGDFEHRGYTEEEALLTTEITRIMGRDDILITATCIWVPVRRANCAIVFAGFKEDISVVEARKVLSETGGVILMKQDEEYPTPEYVAGKDEVFIGRLRHDAVFRNGLVMWIVADNLRKGSALNAVQIAERFLS